MRLDFSEIENHERFESLVAAYFTDLQKERTNHVTEVVVNPSGTGVDGGRDILVKLRVSDGIVSFNRTWVIQCKFYQSNISTDRLADINIPSLIHSFKASGYLLVCKEGVTSKLTDLFERLEERCPFGYSYKIWTGEQFNRLLLTRSEKMILQQFFPKYYQFAKLNDLL